MDQANQPMACAWQAVSNAPRGQRAEWMLRVQVGRSGCSQVDHEDGDAPEVGVPPKDQPLLGWAGVTVTKLHQSLP